MDSSDAKAEARENPRTRRVRRLILDTAIEVLLTRGAHHVTAAIVAEQADVARTTIYRHWPDQGSLLLATIDALTTPHALEQLPGPLEHDVRLTLERLRERLVARQVRKVFGALAGYASQDEAFGEGQRRFVEQLTMPTMAALQDAQKRGELDKRVDCSLEATLLTGPMLHQYLALRSEITDALIDDIVQRWLAAMSA